jgi:hypothetical protein
MEFKVVKINEAIQECLLYLTKHLIESDIEAQRA